MPSCPSRSAARFLAAPALAAALLVACPGCNGSNGGGPCAGVDCSGHGTCYTDGYWPLCRCDDGYRPAGVECVPDVDGGDADDGDDADGDGGEDGEIREGGCDPAGADDFCDGTILYRCRADGTGYSMVTCPFGCVDDPLRLRCGDLDVPNVTDDALLEVGTGPLAPVADGGPYVVLDTDTGAIAYFDADGTARAPIRPDVTGLDLTSGIYFAAQAQGVGEPNLGVFAVASLSVPEGLTMVGKGSAALVILSGGPVEIRGTLSVAAHGAPWTDVPGPAGGSGGDPRIPAPGGGPGGGSPGTESATAPDSDSGGGGGGFGGAGGAGGTVDDAAGGLGGVAVGADGLEPLFGGSGGGAGGDETVPSGAGGHGGGAVQIVSGSDVTVSGTLVAGGGGGWGGGSSEVRDGPGGGGGSGGAILVEAPVVIVTGVLAANGGGGGGGAGPDAEGGDGEAGSAAASPASGGAGAAGGANRGGQGGAGSSCAAESAPNGTAATFTDGGGGGGGAGRIRLNGLNVSAPGALLSPDPSTGCATVGPLRTR